MRALGQAWRPQEHRRRLNEGGFGSTLRVVRVNDLTTHWTYRDVVEVVEGAGQNLDCIMLPKVASAAQIHWLDLTLTQIETTMGFEVGRIGIEAQIESAEGLINVDAIAAASPRMETIVFGPADFMASINMRSLAIGEQPPGYELADAFHYPLMRILMAARAHDVQAIDGPYVQIQNVDGYRQAARRSAALGYDGKWVLHPSQIAAANETFSPTQDHYDHAENILDAYDWFTSEAGWAARCGNARRRDDRRGIPQDGARHRPSGTCRRDAAARRLDASQRTPQRPHRLRVRCPLSRQNLARSIRCLEGVAVMQFGRYFEEFEIGDLYRHWPGKTVTEYDDHLFCLLTMNHHPLHLDAHFANETTDFKQNVVVGNYIYSLLLGMSVEDISGKAIANLEIESLRHVRPTFHGDTIYGETEVLAKVELRSKSDRGVVSVETRGYTQDGEVVCIFRRKVLVPKQSYGEARGGDSEAAQRREISERSSDESIDFGGSRRQGRAMKKRYEAFLDGGEHLTHGGEYFETYDPATGEILAEVSRVKSEDVNDAVTSARAAFPAWRDTVPSDRGRIFDEVARRLRVEEDTLARLETMDTGQTLRTSRSDVETAARYFEYYSGAADKLHGETIRLGPDYVSYTRNEPFGVIGVITPWNAPINEAARAIAPHWRSATRSYSNHPRTPRLRRWRWPASCRSPAFRPACATSYPATVPRPAPPCVNTRRSANSSSPVRSTPAEGSCGPQLSGCCHSLWS